MRHAGGGVRHGWAAEIVRPVRGPAVAAGARPVRRRGGGAGADPGAADDAEPTGVLFDEQSVPSLLAALETFERHEADLTPQACRASALRFSTGAFRERFTGHVEATWSRWLSGSWSR